MTAIITMSFCVCVLALFVEVGIHDEDYRRERIEQGQMDEYTE